jgi:hypothetical protein
MSFEENYFPLYKIKSIINRFLLNSKINFPFLSYKAKKIHNFFNIVDMFWSKNIFLINKTSFLNK